MNIKKFFVLIFCLKISLTVHNRWFPGRNVFRGNQPDIEPIQVVGYYPYPFPNQTTNPATHPHGVQRPDFQSSRNLRNKLKKGLKIWVGGRKKTVSVQPCGLGFLNMVYFNCTVHRIATVFSRFLCKKDFLGCCSSMQIRPHPT